VETSQGVVGFLLSNERVTESVRLLDNPLELLINVGEIVFDPLGLSNYAADEENAYDSS